MTAQMHRVVTALDADDIERICAFISTPGPTPPRQRREDAVILRLLYNAMLTPTELSELTWADIKIRPDGESAVQIDRGAAQPPETLALDKRTENSLRWLRGGARPAERVIALSAQQIDDRVSAAAESAGFGPGFGAISVRAGAAQDMVKAGARFSDVLAASRDHTPVMPGQSRMDI